MDMNQVHDVTDRALRVFHAAARTGSFTGAARILGVGQPAVSHAMRKLERDLSDPLFERNPTGVSLTPAGRQLFDAVDEAFGVIDEAVEVARRGSGVPATVTLSVSTSLATYWLLPRLALFKRAHDGIDLRVITSDDDRGPARETADLWIPLGPEQWPDDRAWAFATEELFPVAAPGLAAEVGELPPCRMLEAPLLHLEERYEPRFDWYRWFEEMCCPVDARLPGARSNDYSLIVHAALEGQGVAIGWRHIVRPLLAEGRLVRVGSASVVTDSPFRLLARSPRLSAEVAALRDWLVAESDRTDTAGVA